MRLYLLFDLLSLTMQVIANSGVRFIYFKYLLCVNAVYLLSLKSFGKGCFFFQKQHYKNLRHVRKNILANL